MNTSNTRYEYSTAFCIPEGDGWRKAVFLICKKNRSVKRKSGLGMGTFIRLREHVGDLHRVVIVDHADGERSARRALMEGFPGGNGETANYGFAVGWVRPKVGKELPNTNKGKHLENNS